MITSRWVLYRLGPGCVHSAWGSLTGRALSKEAWGTTRRVQGWIQTSKSPFVASAGPELAWGSPVELALLTQGGEKFLNQGCRYGLAAEAHSQMSAQPPGQVRKNPALYGKRSLGPRVRGKGAPSGVTSGPWATYL